MASFATPIDDVQTTLDAAYSPGQTSIAVKPGDGALFGTPSASAPVRITLVAASAIDGVGRISDRSRVATYLCAGRSGDTLSALSFEEGTDQAFARGDLIAVLVDAATISELQDAILSGSVALSAHISDTSNPHNVTAAQVGALTGLNGDVSTSGSGDAAAILASIGMAGTYTKVTTDAKGRVTAGDTLAASDIPTIQESQVAGLIDDLAARALDSSVIHINGSYADPSWITSLAGTKITGNIPGNSATATALATTYTSGTLLGGQGSGTPVAISVGPGLSLSGTTLTAPAAAMSIGNAVTGGTAGRVLFEGNGPVMADSDNLSFDGTTLRVGAFGYPNNFLQFNRDASTVIYVGNQFGSFVFEVTQTPITLSGYASGSNFSTSGMILYSGTPTPPKLTLAPAASLQAVGTVSGRVAFPVGDTGGILRETCRIEVVSTDITYAATKGEMDFYAGGNVLTLRLDGSGAQILGALSLATLADASAPNSSLYLGSGHLDGAGAPKLCRKDSAGNVTVIG